MEWIISTIIFLLIVWIGYCFGWALEEKYYDYNNNIKKFKDARLIEKIIMATLCIILVAFTLGIVGFAIWVIHFVIYVRE